MEAMNEKLLQAYTYCIEARYLDKRLRELWGEYHPRSLFSGYGAELAPAILGTVLDRSDYLIPQYRGFAGFLAKGVKLESIVQEIFGKSGGTSNGLGDASSYRDPSCGIPGYTISLGGTFAVAVGLAMAVKRRQENMIVVMAFGDGEASRTPFGSTLNLAALWKLPLLFVCFNNGISIASSFTEMSSTKTIVRRAHGYGIEGEVLNEKDPLRLFGRVQSAVERVRLRREPFFLEILQKRYTAHSSAYEEKPAEHSRIAEEDDGIVLLGKALQGKGVSAERMSDVRQDALRRVEEAITKGHEAEPLSESEFLSIYFE